MRHLVGLSDGRQNPEKIDENNTFIRYSDEFRVNSHPLTVALKRQAWLRVTLWLALVHRSSRSTSFVQAGLYKFSVQRTDALGWFLV